MMTKDAVPLWTRENGGLSEDAWMRTGCLDSPCSLSLDIGVFPKASIFFFLFRGLGHPSSGGYGIRSAPELPGSANTPSHPLPHTFARRLATLIESGSSRDTNMLIRDCGKSAGGYGCAMSSKTQRSPAWNVVPLAAWNAEVGPSGRRPDQPLGSGADALFYINHSTG